MRATHRKRFQAYMSDDGSGGVDAAALRAAYEALGDCEASLDAGRRHYKRQRVSDAIAAFKRAVLRARLDGRDELEARALFNCAWVLRHVGRHQEARVFLRPCCRLWHILERRESRELGPKRTERRKNYNQVLYDTAKNLMQCQRWAAAKSCCAHVRGLARTKQAVELCRKLEAQIDEEIARGSIVRSPR
mmetsp:Transcript_10388/g.31140  ORF Transcript_10388/g.31140 Transcript_10388/m.31140 type:complete len:190 (-) Transcript_10388:78-647(-)